MKLFYLALSLIFFFIPFSILGETISDLIWNNGLYYKKGSKNPFDGIVTGEINGSFKNGQDIIIMGECFLYQIFI